MRTVQSDKNEIN